MLLGFVVKKVCCKESNWVFRRQPFWDFSLDYFLSLFPIASFTIPTLFFSAPAAVLRTFGGEVDVSCVGGWFFIKEL